MRFVIMRWAVAILVLVTVPVLPATALAANKEIYRLKGSVTGDANSVVSMKVVVKNGEPRKVKDFAWQGLDGTCDGVASEEQRGSFTTSAKTQSVNDFRVFGPYDQAASDGDVADISGFVKNKGKKVTGGLIAVYFNDGLCSAPPLGSREFTAKKV